MARITVYIPDEVLDRAKHAYLVRNKRKGISINTSELVTSALGMYASGPIRSEISERGRRETLRAARATRAALEQLEATLTQARPVKRRVRRV